MWIRRLLYSAMILGLLALSTVVMTAEAYAECKVTSSDPTYTDGQLKDLKCDTAGNLSVSVSSGTVSATATAAAPTLTEGDTAAPLSVDLSGNLRMTLGTLISGEDETNNLLMTSGGVVRLTQIVGTGGVPSTATDATTSAQVLPVGKKTFHGLVTCTGTCVQVQKVYGAQESSATVAKSVLVGTIQMSGAGSNAPATGFFTTDENFSYWFVVTSGTSGTTPLSSLMVMY